MTLEPIITGDGSPSFRNPHYDQPYHSQSGAIEESFQKYAIPLKIWTVESPVIYDVCFGIGYNAAAAIDVFRERGGRGKITIYCYENDEEILQKIMEINPLFKNFDMIKKMILNYFEKKETIFQEDNVTLVLVVGDARETIKKIENKADFVFFDPFSPKKHPEMWEESFFLDIFNKMKPESVLSTYSYARLVRENLAKAGFNVTAGPIIGRRSPSTIATKASNHSFISAENTI